MTNEQIERTIEFILEQQAKFNTDLAQLRQVLETHIEETNRSIEQTNRNIRQLVDVSLSLHNIISQHADQIAELREQSQATDARVKETSASLNALIDAVNRTLLRRDDSPDKD